MDSQQQAQFEVYNKIKLLGEGAFGKAYLVECQSDKSLAVIKQIVISKMSEKERVETLKEAQILKVFNHPNIVRFRESYKTKKGHLCIVMDFADGGDLAKKIEEQKGRYFQESQILDWFTQISLGIKHVHDRKILHRDIKAQNIFTTKQGIIKIGDFGIARVLRATVDVARSMVGTPYYLSPEIIEGRPYSFKSDIWSLGVMLYELCALKPPFEGNNMHFLAMSIVRGKFKPLPNYFSYELRELVNDMLSSDVYRRPTINQILKRPFLSVRIKKFLVQDQFNDEFSHTILHRQQVVLEDPETFSQPINQAPQVPKFVEQQKIAPIPPQSKTPIKENIIFPNLPTRPATALNSQEKSKDVRSGEKQPISVVPASPGSILDEIKRRRALQQKEDQIKGKPTFEVVTPAITPQKQNRYGVRPQSDLTSRKPNPELNSNQEPQGIQNLRNQQVKPSPAPLPFKKFLPGDSQKQFEQANQKKVEVSTPILKKGISENIPDQKQDKDLNEYLEKIKEVNKLIDKIQEENIGVKINLREKKEVKPNLIHLYKFEGEEEKQEENTIDVSGLAVLGEEIESEGMGKSFLDKSTIFSEFEQSMQKSKNFSESYKNSDDSDNDVDYTEAELEKLRPQIELNTSEQQDREDDNFDDEEDNSQQTDDYLKELKQEQDESAAQIIKDFELMNQEKETPLSPIDLAGIPQLKVSLPSIKDQNESLRQYFIQMISQKYFATLVNEKAKNKINECIDLIRNYESKSQKISTNFYYHNCDRFGSKGKQDILLLIQDQMGESVSKEKATRFLEEISSLMMVTG